MKSTIIVFATLDELRTWGPVWRGVVALGHQEANACGEESL